VAVRIAVFLNIEYQNRQDAKAAEEIPMNLGVLGALTVDFFRGAAF
jgi:hypothetical protein